MYKMITGLCSLVFLITLSQAQVKMPQPSPTQTIKQDFGLGSIELTYSRPAMKGRKIFGDLVPFGKIWRTGANAATRLVFSDPVEIGGKRIDSGAYVLYTLPGIDQWELILNKGLTNWGTNGYKEMQDVVRFKISPEKIKPSAESFTMQFANIKPETCELHIFWDNTLIIIPISENIKDKLRSQIDAALLTDKKPYWQAAQFYNEYEKNSTKSIEYCNKAIEETPKAYWIWLYKARIQNETGDAVTARQSSTKSLELAKEDKNEDYIKMNEDFLKKLK